MHVDVDVGRQNPGQAYLVKNAERFYEEADRTYSNTKGPICLFM